MYKKQRLNTIGCTICCRGSLPNTQCHLGIGLVIWYLRHRQFCIEHLHHHRFMKPQMVQLLLHWLNFKLHHNWTSLHMQSVVLVCQLVETAVTATLILVLIWLSSGRIATVSTATLWTIRWHLNHLFWSPLVLKNIKKYLIISRY